MTARTYDRITMICMAVAAGSALLFDKFPPARLVIGLVGVIAGMIATAVYFRNQWVGDGDSRPATTERSDPPAPLDARVPSMGVPGASGSEVADPSTLLHIGTANPGKLDVKWTLSEVFAESVQSVVVYEALFAEFRSRQASPSVDAVVELVDRLFVRRGRSYEIMVHPDGRFTVRAPERGGRDDERGEVAKTTFFESDRAIAEWAERQGLRRPR